MQPRMATVMINGTRFRIGPAIAELNIEISAEE
jgi:hypothetical protein